MNELLTIVFEAAALLAGGVTVFSLVAMTRSEFARAAQAELATVPAEPWDDTRY